MRLAVLPAARFSSVKPTAPAQNAAAAAAAPASEAGPLSQFGWVPVATLGAAYAISNEIYFLNEETLVAGCFGAFVFIAYTAFGDSVAKAMDEGRDEIRQQFHALYRDDIEGTKQLLDAYRLNLEAAKDLDGLLQEYRSIADDMAAAQERTYQAEYYGAVSQVLNRLYQTERSVVGGVQEQLAAGSREHVREMFAKAPAKEKDASVTEAIKAIGGGPAPKNEAMVNYFKQYIADAKAGMNKSFKNLAFDPEELKAAQERVDAAAQAEGFESKKLPTHYK